MNARSIKRMLCFAAVLVLIGAMPPELDLRIAGLIDVVRVTFDQMGVPNIYASNPHDLFLAQGYLHASDRWWQMEITRRRAAGRLAQLLGSDFVESDRLVRTMRLPEIAAHDLQLLSPETRALLDAYTAGVNAWWVGKNPADAVPEYAFLAQQGVPTEIEPWRPEDTMLLQVIQTFGSDQVSLAAELAKTKVDQTAGPLAAALVVPSYPYGINPTVLHPGATTAAVSADVSTTQAIPAFQGLLDVPMLGSFGSNNWVVNGARSATGKPLLANDSHWEVEMPSAWYEIGLHCTELSQACPYDVFGFSFAGAPGVIAGHNQRIAWGVTNAFNDNIDVFLLDTNPANPRQYRYNGAYLDVGTHTEAIPVLDAAPVDVEIRTSRFGAVFDSLFGVVLDQPFAVRWAANDGNRSLDSVLRLNRATTWDEFQQALAYFDLPGLHVVYADVAGNIGYVNSGRIPRRVSGQEGSIATTARGSADDWQGYVDPADNPRLFNPDAGFIVSANNAAAAPGDFPFTIATFQDYGFRAARIETLLKQEQTHTADTFARIQLDTYNPAAALVVPVLAQIDFGDAELNSAARWLTQWYGYQNGVSSPQAALFNVFWTRLMHLALEELPIYEGSHDLYLMSNMIRGVHPLWANAQRGYGIASRDQVLGDALREALDFMNAQYGSERNNWKWGDLHFTHFDTLLPSRFQAAGLFDRQASTPGGWATVNTSEWNIAAEDFTATKIASMRMILDLGNFDNSRFINSTGQSGDPRSPHYDDQLLSWSTGEYQPVPTTALTWSLRPGTSARDS